MLISSAELHELTTAALPVPTTTGTVVEGQLSALVSAQLPTPVTINFADTVGALVFNATGLNAKSMRGVCCALIGAISESFRLEINAELEVYDSAGALFEKETLGVTNGRARPNYSGASGVSALVHIAECVNIASIKITFRFSKLPGSAAGNIGKVRIPKLWIGNVWEGQKNSKSGATPALMSITQGLVATTPPERNKGQSVRGAVSVPVQFLQFTLSALPLSEFYLWLFPEFERRGNDLPFLVSLNAPLPDTALPNQYHSVFASRQAIYGLRVNDLTAQVASVTDQPVLTVTLRFHSVT